MEKAVNILGALSLALTDEIRLAIDKSLGTGGETGAALIMMGAHPGLSIGEVAQALRLSHSGAVRLIDRLEAEGLVVREVLAVDQRSVLLKLTDEGQAKRIRALNQRENVLHTAMSSLSPDEIKTVGNILGKVLGGLLTVRDGQCYRLCRMCDEDSCVPSICPVEEQWGHLFGGDGERARKP